MNNRSTIPSAPAHAKHSHDCVRDTHGRFRPEHEHCFPERPKNGRGSTDLVPERKDFPATGTPDTLLQAHQQEEEFERGERIAASEHIIPETDASEFIENEQDDWLDKDASQ